MRILNIGSINIDHVYEVEHFVRPGETLTGQRYSIFAGGKGFNQSVALARAGAATVHAGSDGKHAEWLQERLRQEGVDTTFVQTCGTATGHAIIQVVPSGDTFIGFFLAELMRTGRPREALALGCRAAAACVTRAGAADSIPLREEVAE